ncbi:MAG TPA: glycoside hydrolase domain-containing protein, partial [Longimicrobiaceae bacterium]|nr:glycoside hydrolase domain-containing protein [Longimicrobiaceae bacterium]
MSLPGTVRKAPPGLMGFDTNHPLSDDAEVKRFFDTGHRFCLRYVGREVMTPHDLSAKEAVRILSGGLALMPVQHVQNEGWTPTPELGAKYGRNAARFVEELGFPEGVNVWLDLEGVAKGVPAPDVVAYCNNWYNSVSAAGFTPGIYVGWRPGLTGKQLYQKLRFQHYWGAYNVDVTIPVRGWTLKQSVAHDGPGHEHQDDKTVTDGKGGRVLWLTTFAGVQNEDDAVKQPVASVQVPAL